MANTMRACVMHAPGDLRCEEVPIPVPEKGEVLVKVQATGSCGSDLSRIMKSGYYSLPHIPGHEFAGEVVDVNGADGGFHVGDRVTVIPLIPCYNCESCKKGWYSLCEHYDYLGSRSAGALAEFVRAPKKNLVRLPEKVDYEAAALTDPAAVAIHGFNRVGGIRNDEKMIIFGAGPIGLLSLQFAIAQGVKFVGLVDIDDQKLELGARQGATLCINSQQDDPVPVIMAATNQRGADIIFDTSSAPMTKVQSVLVTAKRGRVVYIGRPYGSFTFTDSVFEHMLRTETLIMTSINYSFTEQENDWITALELMASGKMDANSLITHRFTLEETPEAYKQMWSKELKYNKVLFLPQKNEKVR